MTPSHALRPHLPPVLTDREIDLREQTTEDNAFLCELYVSTRWDEATTIGWPDGQKIAFLQQQFAFQNLHYTRHYVGTSRWLVSIQDHPIGRLYLYPTPNDIRIVDISLLPSHRGQGIGAALITATFDLARKRGNAVSLHVAIFNPARRLYDRMGFTPKGETSDIYQEMVWCPQQESNLS
ncbi:MAG: GNAT family N-acetyltransferase [Rhodospirillaceae bacterium]|nr:GNAT family N-acetyltransferase [Rhodospirillaceae bacterium]